MPIRPENRDRYPLDWPEISAGIRFGRAGGRCECLGECARGTHDGRCPNEHGLPAYGTGSTVVLTTAHLDHTPENCQPDNLRAMCQGCHLHYDRDHHRQTAAATRRAAVEAAGQLAIDTRPEHHKGEPTVIENTNNPAARDDFLLGALLGQTNDQLIGAQEARGQQQLVHSDRLPTELRDDRAAFEALGFVFGTPDADDPLFTPATLPDGWTREAADDHDMWSYVVDTLGRRRVAVFYKAAFYDRRADMHIVSVREYVSSQVYRERPIVTDDTWATPQAVVDAAQARMNECDRHLNTWAKDNATEAVRLRAQRAQYAAVAAQFTSAT